MRPSTNARTGEAECNLTVIDLGPATVSEASVYILGDIFFQLFSA
jgi:hypothetical protein